MSSCESDQNKYLGILVTSKKRKKTGRMTEVRKKMNIQGHTPGPDCKCVRYKCFQTINISARQQIIRDFNLLPTVDEQNIYLCGLIFVQPIQQRRPRQSEDNSKLHGAAYSYRVRIVDEGNRVLEVPVCYKAFLSIHGIGKKKVEILQKELKLTGKAPVYQKGKHDTRPRKLCEETKRAITEHIKSFKGIHSHYSLNDTSKIYLPEELSVKKMHKMYSETYPDNASSYETYRTIFSTQFNISFGYPRSDTCSTCDEFNIKLKSFEEEKKNYITSVEEPSNAENIMEEIKRLEAEKQLHHLSAQTFYTQKTTARIQSKNYYTKEAICMDFQKNLHVPNISTNDVYYKTQLSVFHFNIHILSTGRSVFYVYPETVAKKGSDDICSMIYHFINIYLEHRVRELVIFCGGQNKNPTVFRFLHYLVHEEKRFDSIQITFPIRGHSYMETDKNMSLINQRSRAEIPGDWADVIRSARKRPMPFDVVEPDQSFFYSWTTFLQPSYSKKCPFPSTPIREMKIHSSSPRLIHHRASYNGPYESTVVRLAKRRSINKEDKEHLENLYRGLIPLSKKTFLDVNHLKKFCSLESQTYFENLPFKDH